MPVLSVIIPMYNEEDVLPETHRRLSRALEETGESCEIIYVDDGCTDTSAFIIQRIMETDERVRLIRFARNFGHMSAITAGMDYATGDAVAIIDADLQDPPELLPEMLRCWREGYKVVYGQRESRRGESRLKLLSAFLFYRVLNWFSSVHISEDTGEFRLMDRAVVDVLRRMREHNRFMRGLSSYAGFSSKAVLYKRDERWAGTTKYPLKSMLRLAANGIFSFSTKPLLLLTVCGLGMSLVGVIWLIWAMCIAHTPLGGMMAFMSVLAGILLAGMGVLGAYIGRIYEEAKGRPLYWTSCVLGFNKEAKHEPINNESGGEQT